MKETKSLDSYHHIKKIIIRYLKFNIYDRDFLLIKISELLQYYKVSDNSIINGIVDKTILLMKKINKEKAGNSLIYSSIHSTKGENLRSALIFEDDSSVIPQHNHLSIILNSLYSPNEREHYNSLEENLLYVALSRSKFLNVYALPYNRFSEENYYEMSKDWEKICII